MTPDNASDSAIGNPGQGTPKLADRLSALVGQTAARQDETVGAERLLAAITTHVDASTGQLHERIAGVERAQADRLAALETLVAERLGAVEAAVDTLAAAGGDAGLKAHVDEVGGAVVLRLDEVLAGLEEQIEASRVTLAEQSATALRASEETTAALEATRSQLVAQVEGVDATVRGHVGDLAAGVLELGGGAGLTRDDVDASLQAALPALLDGVAQGAQLDGVSATTHALRDQLDEVATGLAAMRAEFDGLQAAIEQRVDDAALALAETLVAVIASLPSARPPAVLSYDFDELPALEGGDTDDDWPAADPVEELLEHEPDTETEPAELVSVGDSLPPETVAELEEAAIVEESEEQSTGVDEGSSYENASAEQPLKRKGLFRR